MLVSLKEYLDGIPILGTQRCNILLSLNNRKAANTKSPDTIFQFLFVSFRFSRDGLMLYNGFNPNGYQITNNCKQV